MRTALEIYNEVVMDFKVEAPESDASFTQICVDAINKNRIETIRECAEKATTHMDYQETSRRGMSIVSNIVTVNKESILSLINEVK